MATSTAPATDTVECDGCPGDGKYRGHGYVENGVFKGATGTCFRCQGKGRQTPADVKRCTYYDNHVRRIRL
jgi:DnaJ-class molecular chaperone